MSRLRVLTLALAATGVLAIRAAGQAAPFDEGTFVVSRHGAVIGKEAFRIMRSSDRGQLYTSTAQCAFGDKRISPALSVDGGGIPLLYRLEVKSGGEVEERLQATGRPGRLHAVLQTRTGESAKEYVVQNGALILDEDVFHHYSFVPLARRSGGITVVVPRRNTQVSGQVEERGPDKVRVDGKEVSAVHFVVTLPDGARDLWFDEGGRLLKVALPARGVVALREELPR